MINLSIIIDIGVISMDSNLIKKYESWKNKLLDLGKRNRLINYKDTKRTSLMFVNPKYTELWDTIAIKEDVIIFPQVEFDEEGNKIEYEIKTNKSFNDMIKTLKNLRNRSNLIQSEQGINSLYLTIGFLEWKESDSSNYVLKSPLVLVPVQLTISSITSPYELSIAEDDIVINPCLSYKLSNEYGISLPEFDMDNLDDFFIQLEKVIRSKQDWEISYESSISIMSFLKINMYKDLIDRKEQILANDLVKTIAGIPNNSQKDTELDTNDLDNKVKVTDTFQVVDADASQFEAIYYAKNGKSFILQGPPGTGKSQTITNIIAESIADGKKVLFVSEKMAALEVVLNRLNSVGLGDFCLPLHSSKANKKIVIEQLIHTLELGNDKSFVKEEAYKNLEKLEEEKKKLNQYAKEIYEEVQPLNKSIYDINGELSKLTNYDDFIFHINNVDNISRQDLNEICNAIKQYSRTVGLTTKDYLNNIWLNSNIENLDNELRYDIRANLGEILDKLPDLERKYELFENRINLGIKPNYSILKTIKELRNILENARKIPFKWINDDIESYFDEVNKYEKESNKYNDLLNEYGDLYNSLRILEKTLSKTNVEEIVDYANANFEKDRIKEIIKNDSLLDNWINNEKLRDAKSKYKQSKEICDIIRKLKDELFVNYNKDILLIDYKEIESRFRLEYTNFFKYFKSSYKQDKKKFLLLKNEFSKKIEDKEIIDTISLLKKIEEQNSWLEYNQEKIENCFLDYKINEDTDFEFLKNKFDIADKLIEILDKIDNIINVAKYFEDEKNTLLNHYYYFYHGVNTDWNSILDNLKWAIELKKVVKNSEISESIIKKICEEIDFSSLIIEASEDLISDYNQVQDKILWFANLFEDPKEILNMNIDSLRIRIQTAKDNLVELEKWIDLKKARQKCKDLDLDDFLSILDKQEINSEDILPIFLKRFYNLWLDKAMIKYPSVANFRRSEHDELVKSFDELDKVQFKIAQARIRKRLMNQLPSTNRLSFSGNDEIQVLMRESKKQRRIKPIRKLFSEISQLVLTLKPCLMMSPLSVSMFLEGDNFNFDIVIFDEASQVMTENAIGAISRAKQVIIAGDSKQLPPTNFFNSSTSSDDYDNDEEDFYDDEFESLLDEASLLPEKTLLWHYRSRHESLIAFSNAKIYKNKLTTFPSNVTDKDGLGVKYFYVEDGVYDRGGKKGNVNEAKKVANLVFEHFKKSPNKSLGVITFGEVQQQAIENEIVILRKNNPQFEMFFDDQIEEPFFIKNLENVQGDERDTIIFSIGYAKDKNGDFKMNFGPLSKLGGERRLNVAITRAKYCVELVGSILPTDINIDKISTEGPKLLRNYIEYAINGEQILDNIVNENDVVEHDSPFEESVYNFLDRKGFKVVTQVGCSGYRIDMAVKHPTKSGIYVLGIECDGASYHSAKNARERDRLRQEVLENMGWTIYRIWSTDWIKDPKAEGELLLKAINEAIEKYDVENSSLESFLKDNSVISDDFIKTEKKSENDIYDDYGFEKFSPMPTYEEMMESSDENFGMKEYICKIIENEYPINIEIIASRVKHYFGREKVTSSFKDQIEWFISDIDDKIKIIDGFYYPKNFECIPIRLPNKRDFQNISCNELQVLIVKLLKHHVGVDKKTIITEAAKLYGFSRVGNNISNAMENAIDTLIGNGNIKVDNNKLVLLNDKINIQ